MVIVCYFCVNKLFEPVHIL